MYRYQTERCQVISSIHSKTPIRAANDTLSTRRQASLAAMTGSRSAYAWMTVMHMDAISDIATAPVGDRGPPQCRVSQVGQACLTLSAALAYLAWDSRFACLMRLSTNRKKQHLDTIDDD